MLEHLTVLQVKQTVTNMVPMTSKCIYVTPRFHPSPVNLLDFTTQFDVDPSHITLMTKDFLRCLFVLEGFRSRPDLEERMDWGHKGRVLVYERAEDGPLLNRRIGENPEQRDHQGLDMEAHLVG